MKKLLIYLVLFLTFQNSFSQNQRLYNSLIAHYNLLNNQSFAEMQLEDTAGNVFNTSALHGKTVYVDFWFTACVPCLREIPYAAQLQQFFAGDTNIVFVSICIENIQRKQVWKKMINEKNMHGIQLFYPLNRPQNINLLRLYHITFPTYLLVNKSMNVTGYDAPRPSEKGWVHWAILKASEGKLLSESYKAVFNGSKEYEAFIQKNIASF